LKIFMCTLKTETKETLYWFWYTKINSKFTWKCICDLIFYKKW